MNCGNVSLFFDSLNAMSVKELDRIRKHVEKVIDSKKSEDRKHIGSLNVNDFVSYHPNYLKECDISRISSDLNSCGNFSHCAKATKSMWLSTTNLPYKWASYNLGKTTVKEANPMRDFPSIHTLLDNINASMGTKLNSCLIQFYPNGSSGIRLHDDFEWEMDHSQPFVNISIGGCRKIEFFNNYQKCSETPAKVVKAENGSMYTMNKECQKYFRHRVPTSGNKLEPRFNLSFRSILDLNNVPMVSCSGPTSLNSEHDSWWTPVKVALPHSRRHVSSSWSSPRSLPAIPRAKEASPYAPRTAPNTPQPKAIPSLSSATPSAPPPDNACAPLLGVSSTPHPKVPSAPIKEASPTFPPEVPSAPLLEASPTLPPNVPSSPPGLQRVSQPVDHRNVTVLFGTSISRHLDCNFISNRDTEFVNISVSGAKLLNPRWNKSIPDIATMVRDFAETQSNKVARVDRVIFSCGTNDIKHLSSKQLGPIHRQLCDLVVLARKVFGQRVDINFQSVLPMRILYNYTVENFLNFNRLLQSICCSYRCNFIDWFRDFLDFEGNEVNLMFYADPIHLNRRGISYLNRLIFDFIRFRTNSGHSDL